MGTYDIAQICREGHVVNTMARDYPESNEAFCAKCGSATVTACDGCQAAIRGHYHVPGPLAPLPPLPTLPTRPMGSVLRSAMS